MVDQVQHLAQTTVDPHQHPLKTVVTKLTIQTQIPHNVPHPRLHTPTQAHHHHSAIWRIPQDMVTIILALVLYHPHNALLQEWVVDTHLKGELKVVVQDMLGVIKDKRRDLHDWLVRLRMWIMSMEEEALHLDLDKHRRVIDSEVIE